MAALAGWAFSALSTPIAVAVTALVGITAAGVDLQILHLPSNRRQIRASVLRTTTRWRAMFRYGATLGSGLLTYLPYYAVATAAAWAAAEWGAAAGLVTGAAFGVGRTAFVPVLVAVSRSRGGLVQIYGSGQVITRRASVALSLAVVILASLRLPAL